MSKPKSLQAIHELDKHGFYNGSTYAGPCSIEILDTLIENGIYTLDGGYTYPLEEDSGDNAGLTVSYTWILEVYSCSDSTIITQDIYRVVSTGSGFIEYRYRRYKDGSIGSWSEFKRVDLLPSGLDSTTIASYESTAGCKGFYIKSIDLVNKKIYLNEIKVNPTIDTADNTDTKFNTPAYNVGDKFTIMNGNNYPLCGTIKTISNNVVTYEEEDLGFTEIQSDTAIDGHTFSVPSKPEVGCISFVTHAVSLGDSNKASAKAGFIAGRNNLLAGAYGAITGRGNITAYGATSDGAYNESLGQFSHTSGTKNKVTRKGYGAFTHGSNNFIDAKHGSGLGIGLKVVKDCQSAKGRWNKPDTTALEVLGNGTSDTNRSNAYTVDEKGNFRISGDVYIGGTEEGDSRLNKLVTIEDVRNRFFSVNPLILKYQKNTPIYKEVRGATVSDTLQDDSTGLYYVRIVPSNVNSPTTVDYYSLPNITIENNKVYIKILMRTNQQVDPGVLVYTMKDSNGTTLANKLQGSHNSASIRGDGEWEELLIEVSTPTEAATYAQIHIRPIGISSKGSSYYDYEGNLIGNPYFDIAAWAAFPDLETANSYNFMDELVGNGSLSIEHIYNYVKDTINSVQAIGDIRTTTLRYLGDSWLLCNGSYVLERDYPKLAKALLPGSFSKVVRTNPVDTGTGSYVEFPEDSTHREHPIRNSLMYANGIWALMVTDEYAAYSEVRTCTSLYYTNDIFASGDWNRITLDTKSSSCLLSYYNNKWYAAHWDDALKSATKIIIKTSPSMSDSFTTAKTFTVGRYSDSDQHIQGIGHGNNQTAIVGYFHNGTVSERFPFILYENSDSKWGELRLSNLSEAKEFISILYNSDKNIWVALSPNGTISCSTDLTSKDSWVIKGKIDPDATNMVKIIYQDGIYIAIGQIVGESNNYACIYTSENLIDWSFYKINSLYPPRDIIYADNLWYILLSNGYVYSFSDTTMKDFTFYASLEDNLGCLCYGKPGLWVAGGAGRINTELVYKLPIVSIADGVYSYIKAKE